MLIKSPGNMFAYQGRRVVLPLAQCLYDAFGRRRVAQRYGNIAQPAFIADAANGGASGLRKECVFIP